MVSNGNVMLDGLMFDPLIVYPFAVTVVFVRAKASVLPHTSDVVVMHGVIKGDVF